MSVDMDKVSVMEAYSNPLCVCVVHCIWRHSYTVKAPNSLPTRDTTLMVLP